MLNNKFKEFEMRLSEATNLGALYEWTQISCCESNSLNT